MTNQLIPLTRCDQTSDEYQPELVPHGYKFDWLIPSKDKRDGGYYTRFEQSGFSFRSDLKGMVHHCGSLPIIETDDGGLFAVQNPDAFISACWR